MHNAEPRSKWKAVPMPECQNCAAAEAEVAELRQKLAACELLLTDLGKTFTRVHAERDELRATVDRVRALADEWRSHYELPPIHRPPLMHWDQVADILRAALDGGES